MSRFSGNAVKQGSTSARSSPFSAGSSLFSADLLSDANVFVHMLIEVINGRKLFWAARALVAILGWVSYWNINIGPFHMFCLYVTFHIRLIWCWICALWTLAMHLFKMTSNIFLSLNSDSTVGTLLRLFKSYHWNQMVNFTLCQRLKFPTVPVT